MRTAYVGLYYDSEGKVIEMAHLISEMTHRGSEVSAACVAYSVMLYRLVNAKNPNIGIVKDVAKAYLWNDAYDYDALTANDYVPSTTGYVVDTFATALHCLYTTDSFEDALIKAVNLGGDTDTIGAVTGGLAGALYGATEIPLRWSTKLPDKIVPKLRKLAMAAWG